MKQKMIIGFIILGILSMMIGVCMYFDVLNTKPLFVKWYAGIIIASGTILLGYITLSYDKSSSRKTDDILENTRSAGSGIIDLNEKADTSNSKIDILKEENDILKLQITNLDTILSEKNKTILELSQQTADLSIRLSEKAKSIYDLNKAIKFSMPNRISVSYHLFFRLEEQFQEKADSILKGFYKFTNTTSYLSVSYDLIKDLLEWNEHMSNWMTVSFAKDYKISKTEANYTSLLAFTNFDFRQQVEKLILYNPTERGFLIEIEDAPLSKQIFPNLSLTPNLVNTSIFDLAKSTMILNQSFPERFKQINIINFKISSPELNLLFRKLKRTENDQAFIGDVKLSEDDK